MGTGFLVDRWINILFIAIFTAFLVIPVAYLSANPDFVIQRSGELLADYCIRTGVCDFRQLKAGLGVSLFVMATLFIAFLEAIKPEYSRDETLDEIEGMLVKLQGWYVYDHPEEEEEDKELRSKKELLRNRVFAFSLILSVFLISWAITSANIQSPVLNLLLGLTSTLSVAFSFYLFAMFVFWPDREMFWERNKYIRKLYRELEAEREADQA